MLAGMDGALDPEGWNHSDGGKVVDGLPQWVVDGPYAAYFKHSRPVNANDVFRMRVESGNAAIVGFAGQQYNPEKHWETNKSTAIVNLKNGTTAIYSAISLHEERHYHGSHLEDRIPETKPYDVALRITKDGNMPQIQFNDDGEWHDFVPEGEGALKAGPWFSYLQTHDGDRLIDHRVDRPRPTKSAGKTKGVAAADGAGAAGVEWD
jgi:hypothetical protein